MTGILIVLAATNRRSSSRAPAPAIERLDADADRAVAPPACDHGFDEVPMFHAKMSPFVPSRVARLGHDTVLERRALIEGSEF